MKLSFDIPQKNYKIVEEVKKDFPQISKYRNNEINWEDIVAMDLHHICSHDYTFTKYQDKLGYILGDVNPVTFEDLQELFKTHSKDYLKLSRKRAENEADIGEEELLEAKKSIKRLNSVTKEEFDRAFWKKNEYDILFPHLYRLETTMYDYMFPEIFNYLVNEGVEIHSFVITEFDEVTEEIENSDIPKSNDQINRIDRTKEFLEKFKNEIFELDIDIKYLKGNISKAIESVDNKSRKRNLSLNDLID